MTQSSGTAPLPPNELDRLEREERRLWWISILLLVVLAAGFAVTSWKTVRDLPLRLEALPVGMVVLVALFAAYIWGKKREMRELRAFVRGLEQRAAAPPTEQQLEQLIGILSKSQRGYRDLIDSLDQVVFTVSLDGRIQIANRRLAELFDLPITDLIGRSLDEFITEPTPVQAEKHVARFLERRLWTGVIRVGLRRTGETRYFDCILHAVVRDGEVAGASGLARDITEQRVSESRFADLFDTVQEGVYFSTPEGRILDVNPALLRMLGYANKDELFDIEAPLLYADPQQRAELIADLERHGTIHEREITLKRKDGSVILCLDSATAVRDAGGRVSRIQGTLVDITLRREIEKRLLEEKEFVRRLIASFPDAIVVLDTSARYTFVSSRIEELLGYSPEELIDRSLGERTDPDDAAALLRMFEDIVHRRIPAGAIEYRTQHKNGSWRMFRASAGPLFDAEGRIAGVVASARDVTELKQMEQQLLQSEKLAAMGQMIAGVAHELNNPLTAILGTSDLLRERATDDALRRQVELVHKQARRAAQIVQGLLSFSRPAVINRTRLDLNELAHRALELQDHSLSERRIAVRWQPCEGLAEIIGDSNQLLQVFLNLIQNAEQAIHEHRDRGNLRVAVTREADTLVVRFEDDGPGVRAEVLPKIFDPFFTTKRPGGGTGLGLTICLAIVRGHGGSIDVSSAPSGGAVFRVSLPAAAPVHPLPERTPEDSAIGLRGRSVLIVDDEESIRDLIEEGLRSRGLVVEAVSGCREALERLAARPFDLVLCDWRMPGMGGRELFEQAGRKNASERFVFMTGDLLDPEVDAFLKRTGTRAVQKPFRLADVVGVISEVLEAGAPRPV